MAPTMSTKVMLAAAVVIGCAALVAGAAYPTTIGLRYRGYTMMSNVTGYTNMTQDQCDIEKLTVAGNNSAALDIYLNGKNSVGGSALRKYQTWATAVHFGEPFFDQLAAYYGPNFTTTLNDTIVQAFNSGNGALAASLITITVQAKYMMHEVDAAYRGVSNNNTNATSGPAHNLDEAWAILAGAHPDSCSTLLGLADDFGADLGATHSGVADTVWAINVLMNELQYYSLTGNSTVAAYNVTAEDLREELAIVLSQAVLGGAYASEIYKTCNVTGLDQNWKSAAFAAWWPLAAQLSAWNATASSLKAVETALTADNVSYAGVKAALLQSSVLGKISAADIGLPVPARLRPANCTATLAA